MLLPNNFINELYSRTLLFTKYAIDRHIDPEEYLNKFKTKKIAITGESELLTSFNGQYMALMIINLLSRFCLNIDVVIHSGIKTSIKFPYITEVSLAKNMINLGKKINPKINISCAASSNQRYDCVIAIGDCYQDLGRTVVINSDGWIAHINTENNSMKWVSNNTNPVGAFAAACLGVAELFKIITKSRNHFNVGSLVFSCFDYSFKLHPYLNPTLPGKLLLSDIHFISMGAINSSALYTLLAIPDIEGNATVIEPQNLDISNLNRYVFALASDAINGILKTDSMMSFAGNSLTLNIINKTYEECENELKNIRLAIVGVDSIQSRWEIQKSYPAHIICGGTNEVGELKISRHTNTDDGACLGCIYPKPIPESDEPTPTISFVSILAGILLAGEIIKIYIQENSYALNNVLELNLLSSSHYRVLFMSRTDSCPIRDSHN